jgi:hypothetical protein
MIRMLVAVFIRFFIVLLVDDIKTQSVAPRIPRLLQHSTDRPNT